MRTLSPAARASAHAQETDEVWLYLMTIQESTLPILRFVNHPASVVSRSKIFLPLPFMLQQPGQSKEEIGEAIIDIDNVDRSIIETLRAMLEPPIVTLEAVLASQPDIVEATVSGLTLRIADYDKSVVSGSLQVEDLISEPITLERTPARYPGMF